MDIVTAMKTTSVHLFLREYLEELNEMTFEKFNEIILLKMKDNWKHIDEFIGEQINSESIPILIDTEDFMDIWWILKRKVKMNINFKEVCLIVNAIHQWDLVSLVSDPSFNAIISLSKRFMSDSPSL